MTTVRRAGTVSAATLSALAAALALTQTVAPRWIRQAGLDVWNWNSAVAEARALNDRMVELRASEERLREEVELAEGLTTHLASGTTSLAAAADVMEPILRERTGFESVVRTRYHSPTFRHGVARYLILRVGRQLDAAPSQWATASARLEAEYSALR